MSGNQSEDCLNYHLIMEGFYYDAEIEHITEVVKNNLYFAVLESENNRMIKNTHDTFYFTIDDELIYINYYFDFGPLNISCAFKYCCKLNKLLQYAQGLKRIVHYTASNPIKRVNAAFLMGCYAIIYLHMESKDVYRILLNAGGPFKLFIDASQGVSQYTIRLLDCLQAVQKALHCNFFNFNDFNIGEYDLHDKLQNGDMNWLVPRKFLAFIGPTDGEGTNGHSPDFYIKYFLESDIRMVIRLNNKVYDSSAFTQAGIQHYDLFFPDGTVPSKQILLKFLELAENCPSAIAVHCKAGLGRTGSLIGAYIIKHYHMTSREAIAWMRVCRPGSVIGQQQAWLEKIESWLWKQGNQFRFEHYGEADKIPHHKYGIYSLEWQNDKEKLVKQVQKPRDTPIKNNRNRPTEATLSKFVEGNVKRNKPKIDSPHSTSENSEMVDYPTRNFNVPKRSSARQSGNIGQKSLSVDKDERLKPSKLGNKASKIPHVEHFENRQMRTPHKLEDISNGKLKSASASRNKQRSDEFEEEKIHRVSEHKSKRYTAPNQNYNDLDMRQKYEASFTLQEPKSSQMKSKKRNQSECREEEVQGKANSRIRRPFVDNLEQTQGDKLNEIKARKVRDMIENDENVKTRQVKPGKHQHGLSKPEAFLNQKIPTLRN